MFSVLSEQIKSNQLIDDSHKFENEEQSQKNQISKMLLSHLKQMYPKYQEYCASKMVIELKTKIDSNVQVETELMEISARNQSYQTFSSGLTRPMQRITKYRLYIESLLKHTPVGHADHENCKATLNYILHFCKDIDEIFGRVCQKLESFQKMIWIEKQMNLNRQLDQTLEFNSETLFLGILFSS